MTGASAGPRRALAGSMTGVRRLFEFLFLLGLALAVLVVALPLEDQGEEFGLALSKSVENHLGMFFHGLAQGVVRSGRGAGGKGQDCQQGWGDAREHGVFL